MLSNNCIDSAKKTAQRERQKVLACPKAALKPERARKLPYFASAQAHVIEADCEKKTISGVYGGLKRRWRSYDGLTMNGVQTQLGPVACLCFDGVLSRRVRAKRRTPDRILV